MREGYKKKLLSPGCLKNWVLTSQRLLSIESSLLVIYILTDFQWVKIQMLASFYFNPFIRRVNDRIKHKYNYIKYALTYSFLTRSHYLYSHGTTWFSSPMLKQQLVRSESEFLLAEFDEELITIYLSCDQINQRPTGSRSSM